MSAFPPFEDSRRLTGPNLHFDVPGAVLESLGPLPQEQDIARWRDHVRVACEALGWPDPQLQARRHASGVAFAFSAPVDQLLAATDVNEWAWLCASHATGRAPDDPAFHAPGHAAVWDAASALHTLRLSAAAERCPRLTALVDRAHTRQRRCLIDDESLSLGSGVGARVWPLMQLPDVDSVDWAALHDIPTALVTGSNGKTTTVRLLAALLRAQGLRCAWSCTEGLFADGERLCDGDYSGPAGARAVLRHAGAEAAVLETARGGLLRRGLAVDRADVAVVTNISVDHFGEYGIHDLDGLTQAKLVVARALRSPRAPLVLNADDEQLVRHAPRQGVTLAWFALDDAHPLLRAHRAAGGTTCGIEAGQMRLHRDGVTHALGPVDDMPLGFGGRARYNLANIAAASLAAVALGVAPATIARVLAEFGCRREDNAGRLQHWHRDGVEIFVDYAHNVEGLRALLDVAGARRAPGGRLGLLLGQAGNREDAQIAELADVAADFAPERIVLKDLAAMLRGREVGEVPVLLRARLESRGVPPDRIHECLDEETAARGLLDWARRGDVIVLPLHTAAVRERILAQLQR